MKNQQLNIILPKKVELFKNCGYYVIDLSNQENNAFTKHIISIDTTNEIKSKVENSLITIDENRQKINQPNERLKLKDGVIL